MGHLKYKRKSSDGQDSARCTRLRPVSRVPLAGEKRELAGLLQESCQVKSREHITPSLLQLHWLPVRWRVQFKLCVIMHCVHNGRAPAYLDNAVQPVNRRTARPGLHSENSLNYYVPRVRTGLGEHAFFYAGPVVWNNLVVDIGAAPDITRFKKILMAYTF